MIVVSKGGWSIALCWAVLSLASAGCREMLRPERPFWPVPPDGHVRYVGAFLQITGVGVAEGEVSTETYRKSLSRDAALLDARGRLRGFLEGLPYPPPYDTVGAKALRHAAFAEQLAGLADSADIASTQWLKDGRAVVILRLLKSRVNPALGTELR